MGEVTAKAWTDYSEPRIMAADLEAIEAGIVDAQQTADATAASTIRGAGRPDIVGTLAPDVATLAAAAPSGAMFRSIDGPQGAWEWMKRGTTWVVITGDTGWVDMGAWFLGDWSGTALARRINSTTHLSLEVYAPTGTTGMEIMRPTGDARRIWAPSRMTRAVLHTSTAPATIYRVNLQTDDKLVLTGAPPAVQPIALFGVFSYPTLITNWPSAI